MFRKPIHTAIAAALIATSPVSAMADNLGAAIVGGIIGGAILNEAAKNRRTTVRSSSSRSSSNSVTRQQNRETQTALNYFGFPAGTPDGVLGNRSRSAISQYQGYLGYPATGTLQPHEREMLVTSYHRAQAGGADVTRAIQRHPDGIRNVLVVWRDERMGGRVRTAGYPGLPLEVSDAVDEIAQSTEPSAEQLLQRAGFIQTADLNGDGKNDYVIDTAVTGSTFWCGQTDCATLLFTSTGSEAYERHQFQYKRNAQLTNKVSVSMFDCNRTRCEILDPETAPVPVATPQPQTTQPPVVASQPQQPATGLPVFGAAPQAQTSLASHCSKVNLMTTGNGGFVTVANLTDPYLALNEQFCLTRTYAIAQGEETVKSLGGVTQAQVDDQCDAFGPTLANYVSMLDSAPASQVIGEVQKFILTTNMSVGQLKTTGSVCLYSGYRRDKMDVALGAALLLVGAGEKPYAELVGHHVQHGFGATESQGQAKDWYAVALSALDNGAAPVFAVGQPDRIDLVRAAVAGEVPPAMAVPTSGSGASLPTFSLE